MRIRLTRCITYREDDEKKEVHVRDVVELKPQILGYKTERGIFCGPDLVALVVSVRAAILVEGISW